MLVQHFAGGHVCHNLMHHLPSLLFPPILDLPLSLPGLCLHWYQVTRFQVHCTHLSVVVTISVCMLLLSIGLAPPVGEVLNLSCTEAMYTSTCLVEASLMGGLIVANDGEDKVNWEPRPMSKHQVVWTVSGSCGSGGIIGMCYFSQMRWPVSFLVFSQLPNYVHNCLVQSLYQPISLGVVGHGPQLFDAKDPAQFLNYVTGEASTSITQEPGHSPEDRDVTSI